MKAFRRTAAAVLFGAIIATSGATASAEPTARAVPQAGPRTQGAQLREFAIAHRSKARPAAKPALNLSTTFNGSAAPFASPICYQKTFTDPYPDAGTADASEYAVLFDCSTQRWLFGAYSPAGLSKTKMQDFVLWVNRDQNEIGRAHV